MWLWIPLPLADLTCAMPGMGPTWSRMRGGCTICVCVCRVVRAECPLHLLLLGGGHGRAAAAGQGGLARGYWRCHDDIGPLWEPASRVATLRKPRAAKRVRAQALPGRVVELGVPGRRRTAHGERWRAAGLAPAIRRGYRRP